VEGREEIPLGAQLVDMNGALKVVAERDDLGPSTPSTWVEDLSAVILRFHFVYVTDHLQKSRGLNDLPMFQHHGDILLQRLHSEMSQLL
jgi:hypothetical protein